MFQITFSTLEALHKSRLCTKNIETVFQQKLNNRNRFTACVVVLSHFESLRVNPYLSQTFQFIHLKDLKNNISVYSS